MRYGFMFTVLIFGSGVIFGLGFNRLFLTDAVKTAYDYGRESVILEVVENGEIQVANR